MVIVFNDNLKCIYQEIQELAEVIVGSNNYHQVCNTRTYTIATFIINNYTTYGYAYCTMQLLTSLYFIDSCR